jgi:hypothetical protein
VRLRNVSAEERQVTGASPDKVYKFSVKDERGRDAGLTEFGQELAKADGQSLELRNNPRFLGGSYEEARPFAAE